MSSGECVRWHFPNIHKSKCCIQIIQTQLDLFFITDELITFRINIIQSQTYMYLSVRGQIHFIYFNAVKVNTLWKAADVKITGIKSDTCRRFGDKKKNKTNYQEQFKRSELSGILCFCNTFAILLQHFAVLKGNYNCVVLYLFACLIHSLISKILKINKWLTKRILRLSSSMIRNPFYLGSLKEWRSK